MALRPYAINQNMMKTRSHNLLVTLAIFLLALALESCAPKPTQPVLADTFFPSQAFIDANGNGQLDSADTPLAKATFIVTLQGGAEFGGQTDETGKAFITIPGAVKYPVTLHMEAPEGSGLKLIGPQSVTSPSPTGELIKFLFSK